MTLLVRDAMTRDVATVEPGLSLAELCKESGSGIPQNPSLPSGDKFPVSQKLLEFVSSPEFDARSAEITRAQLEVDGGRLRLFPNIALRKRIDDYEAEIESVAERAATLAAQPSRKNARTNPRVSSILDTPMASRRSLSSLRRRCQMMAIW